MRYMYGPTTYGRTYDVRTYNHTFVPLFLVTWNHNLLARCWRGYQINLVLRIAISYWDWQCLCILKSFNVIDGWFPSFMCNLLGSSIIPTFICKSHICTMWLQFSHTFNSVFWELNNQYPAVHTTIDMQKVSNGLFCVIFYIFPLRFWIISEHFISFSILGKNHVKWVNKGEIINPTLEWILIQFEPDDLRFKCCRQQCCR